jgi:hypothetical protein
VAIVATGTGANPLVQATTPGLATRSGGYIQADPETLATSRPGVFAGGDIVTGGATVILAMGAGRRAARNIDAWLIPRAPGDDGGTRYARGPSVATGSRVATRPLDRASDPRVIDSPCRGPRDPLSASGR